MSGTCAWPTTIAVTGAADQGAMGLGMVTFFQGDFVRTLALTRGGGSVGRDRRGSVRRRVLAWHIGLAVLETGDIEESARLAAEGQAAARASADSVDRGSRR